MKTSRYTDSQILVIIKQNESGVPVPELCREHDLFYAIETPKAFTTIRKRSAKEKALFRFIYLLLI